MSRRRVASICPGLAVCLALFAGGIGLVRAEDAPGHETPAAVADGPAAAATHGPASTSHDAHATDGHAVDYNKAPLPGAAPGLLSLFLFSLALFVAFVFVARAIVWAPLINALDQREARVNQALADAEVAKASAAQLLATHDIRMAEVHEQVQGIVAAARKEAEQEKSRIVADAEAQARALREEAIGEIEAARESALAELNQSLDGQVAQAVRHVVGHAMG